MIWDNTMEDKDQFIRRKFHMKVVLKIRILDGTIKIK